MQKTETSDALPKPLKPDERRENTDMVFRSIAKAELNDRIAKTERLRRARLQAARKMDS